MQSGRMLNWRKRQSVHDTERSERSGREFHSCGAVAVFLPNSFSYFKHCCDNLEGLSQSLISAAYWELHCRLYGFCLGEVALTVVWTFWGRHRHTLCVCMCHSFICEEATKQQGLDTVFLALRNNFKRFTTWPVGVGYQLFCCTCVCIGF